jgi:hypothetical protein
LSVDENKREELGPQVEAQLSWKYGRGSTHLASPPKLRVYFSMSQNNFQIKRNS